MSQNSNSSRLTSIVLGAILFLLIGVVLGAMFVPDLSRSLFAQLQGAATLEPIQNTENEILSESVVIEPTETSEVELPDPVVVIETEEQVEEVGDIEAEIDGTPITPAIVAPASRALQTEGLQDRLISLYKETNPSVVHIFALVQNVPLGTGTGFVIDNEGHILTNNHVIAGADDLEIKFPNGMRTKAAVIGTDEDADVAVIKVNTFPEGIVPLRLGNSSALEVGEFVVAIGNPFGQASSMSLGIVSAVGRGLPSDRQLPNGGSYQLPDAIQIDAPINPGNSGGPLLNLAGEVVGINARIFSQTGANSGVGFSIPID
ncbi:MAG: trypsin-like peptidase domain-containing protein, partial [Chloroflexota bacterium]